MKDISSQIAQRVGEVVEASTTSFTSQCYTLYEAPPLGSLVRCGDPPTVPPYQGGNKGGIPPYQGGIQGGQGQTIYGVVYEVSTRSMDPARHPIARGRDEETEEAVYLSNPQLSRLLLTEFRSLVVGHQANGQLRRYLSPLPPRIHSFVHQCGGEELRGFSASLEFIPIILAAPMVSAPDDVIASFLRQASAAHPDPEAFLIRAGKELAALMGGQLQRLNNMLRRLSP